MNPNKNFTDLKMKQREHIQEWLYAETLCFYRDNNRMPNKLDREIILERVCIKIENADIWIPFGEVKKYYLSRLIHFEKRVLREIGRE
ncbi:MAG: hypothetical protein J6I55_09695 [Ruminococcus sp.]|nr:hypothetical protein [Ruminococcus sp.]